MSRLTFFDTVLGTCLTNWTGILLHFFLGTEKQTFFGMVFFTWMVNGAS